MCNWTQGGHAAQNHLIRILADKVRAHRSHCFVSTSGANSQNADAALDDAAACQELNTLERRLTDAQLLHRMAQAAPDPKENKLVSFGHLVRAKYETESGVEKEFAFVLGGENEPVAHVDPKNPKYYVQTFFIQAPFGKAFRGQKVGDVVEVKRNRVTIEMEITSIETPQQASQPLLEPWHEGAEDCQKIAA